MEVRYRYRVVVLTAGVRFHKITVIAASADEARRLALQEPNVIVTGRVTNSGRINPKDTTRSHA